MTTTPRPRQPLAERFIAALRRVEDDRDLDLMADLYGDDSRLTRFGASPEHRGRDGAMAFWSEYLNTFERIESRFTAVLEEEGGVVFEWTATGTLTGGHPVDYGGVSILEFDRVTVREFRTYYDSAAFQPTSGSSDSS